MYDVPADVRQAEVATAVPIGELFVSEAQKVQDGGVEVVDVDGIPVGLHAVLVR